MDAHQFRQYGHDIIEVIAQYLENIEERPVSSSLQPGAIRAQLPEHPPHQPEDFSAVLRDVNEIIIPGLTHWQHPSFFAFFPGNTS
jgi:aromatic-L-amino-acid decarboxylase